MRDLKECQAEVFRRSEKRIQERRKVHNRILVLCIPLCLMIAAWSAAMLPAMLYANDRNMSTGNGMDILGSIDGSNTAFIRLEVASAGIATQSIIQKDDVSEVARIYDTVQSSFVSAGGVIDDSASVDPSDEAREEMQNYLQSGMTAMSSGYRIVFTAENGMQAVYSLTGDKLINEATRQEAILPADLRSDLIRMLGLSITWEEGPQ